MLRRMKRLLAGLATVGLVGSSSDLAGELFWADEVWLEHYLHGEDQAKVPASHLLPEEYILCAAGSYQFDLPEGYETAERELKRTGLLPVREGTGLLFSLDGSHRLQDVSTLSVWPAAVMLEAADPICIPATSAKLDLRREGQSIIIKLDDGG